MITADDDGRVHTHDDAMSLIRYAVPGALVSFERQTPRSAGYSIVVRRWGRADVCVWASYSLPAPADQIATHARSQVERQTTA